jgi:putative flavoprotein involved in K+ transport
VRNASRVERLFKRNDRYVVRVGSREIEARQVVVAMSKYQQPDVPDFARSLSSDIVQLHSTDYRSVAQFQPGAVMLVGAGNSGADIALEAVRVGHRTWIAGRDPGQVPFRPERFFGRHVFAPLVLGFMFRHVLTVNTPIGRKARQGVLARGTPLIRVKRGDLIAAGIERAPRVVGVRQGLPLLDDGRVLQVANIVWCTGFHPAFDWIDLPIFDDDGLPQHRSGVVERAPGVYFVGLPFLHSMSSSMINGVGRDAERLVKEIRARAAVGAPETG